MGSETDKTAKKAKKFPVFDGIMNLKTSGRRLRVCSKVITALGCTRKVHYSSLNIDYIPWDSSHDCPQSLQENIGVVHQIMPLPLSSTMFPSHSTSFCGTEIIAKYEGRTESHEQLFFCIRIGNSRRRRVRW